MPGKGGASDRKFLIAIGGAALVLLFFAMLFAAGGKSSNKGYPSSYASSSDGAKAAFALLKEMGHDVQHWEESPSQLPAEGIGSVLVLADPFVSPTADERAAIHRFINSGGTVLATGTFGASFLPGGSAVSTLDEDWEEVKVMQPSSISREAAEIRMETSARWSGSATPVTLAYGGTGKALVVSYPYGSGRVVWWAASTPLTNAGINKARNLQLFLNSLGVEVEDEPTIFWDEYFHGVRNSLWSYVKTTPGPWGIAQLLVAFGFGLLTFARRHGPLRAPVVESRLHPLEFVHTLGSLYQHAKAASPAVASIFQRFRFRLIRQMGLPASLTATELSAAVRERRREVQDLKPTLETAEQCAKGATILPGNAVKLAGQLQQLAEELKLNAISSRKN